MGNSMHPMSPQKQPMASSYMPAEQKTGLPYQDPQHSLRATASPVQQFSRGPTQDRPVSANRPKNQRGFHDIISYGNGIGKSQSVVNNGYSSNAYASGSNGYYTNAYASSGR